MVSLLTRAAETVGYVIENSLGRQGTVRLTQVDNGWVSGKKGTEFECRPKNRTCGDSFAPPLTAIVRKTITAAPPLAEAVNVGTAAEKLDFRALRDILTAKLDAAAGNSGSVSDSSQLLYYSLEYDDD